MLELNKAYNMDCMDGMAQFPDKYFDIAVVDPPYGIFSKRKTVGNRIDKTGHAREWDIKPQPQYFQELFRVSKRQIIWGANNFTLPESEYFIVWDKQQTVPNFASAEYAWTNCKMPAKVFRYSIRKEVCSRTAEGGKIHPTQKPVALYAWIFENYVKAGNKIIDTHLGSGSSRIAAYNAGLDFIGFETDKEYFKKQEERFAAHASQTSLFAIAGGGYQQSSLNQFKKSTDTEERLTQAERNESE